LVSPHPPQRIKKPAAPSGAAGSPAHQPETLRAASSELSFLVDRTPIPVSATEQAVRLKRSGVPGLHQAVVNAQVDRDEGHFALRPEELLFDAVVQLDTSIGIGFPRSQLDQVVSLGARTL